METLVVGGWTVRHDRAATATHYRMTARGDADESGCSFCRNFALQRSTAFPAEFLRLLERLGIDTAKEQEAFDWGPVGDGLHRYGGWFCFVGDFAEAEAAPGAAPDAPRFSFAFTNSFPRRGAWAREGVASIEFITHLPWLLPDEHMDPALR